MTLPPRSPDELREAASHVVLGRAREVYRAVVRRDDRPGWIDTRYCIVVDPEVVETDETDVDPEAPVYAHAWSARDRPEGWSGPGGQGQVPDPGDRVRLYLRRDEGGRLHLLEPDGWERAEG